MLAEAERKRGDLASDVRQYVQFVKGDIRSWPADQGFDLIVTPCSTVSHLLTLEDQVAAWRRARHNLASGGRFVVQVATPDLAACASGAGATPGTVLELDRDSTDAHTGER